MLQRMSTFLAGLMAGLLSTGLLLLLLSEPRGLPIQLHPPPTPRPIQVHVAGAVAQPGVYELLNGSHAQQAIEAAGGPLEGAVLDMVNLASPLEDGQQVYIPIEIDSSPVIPTSVPDFTRVTGELINLNTATDAELESLPGIGPSLAQKIVEWRETNGPFLEPEDIIQVSGIGQSKLEQIRDFITVR